MFLARLGTMSVKYLQNLLAIIIIIIIYSLKPQQVRKTYYIVYYDV